MMTHCLLASLRRIQQPLKREGRGRGREEKDKKKGSESGRGGLNSTEQGAKLAYSGTSLTWTPLVQNKKCEVSSFQWLLSLHTNIEF